MAEDLQTKISNLDCWRSKVQIEPLGGGMTNLNFKVTDGGRQYVVRLGEDDPVHLISRSNEIASSKAAFEAGVSPELVYNEPGVMVVRFIEGRVFQEADIRDDSNLSRIIELLKRFHIQIPKYFRQIPVLFWVFQVLRHYQGLLQEGNSRYAKRLTELDAIAASLEKEVGKVKIVFGHNDLLAANFIDDGEKIWLIDFDYAGFNSPLFDLSNLASNNALSVDQEITMLESYFGSSWNRHQWCGYYAMKCASLLRETLWSMVSEIYSEIEMDFPAYTSKNLERFELAFDDFCREYD
ncbi:MAG: phosphotransferase family protein [Gammaproteobacteria bacterium]|nr:phosphotransferase family protein [Gammaproteobacteria bacterium]